MYGLCGQLEEVGRRTSLTRLPAVWVSHQDVLMLASVEPLDVLILGAGTAGVSAAVKLTELGVTNFLILEAGDDIGGRVKAATLGSYVMELGNNRIQAEDAKL